MKLYRSTTTNNGTTQWHKKWNKLWETFKQFNVIYFVAWQLIHIHVNLSHAMNKDTLLIYNIPRLYVLPSVTYLTYMYFPPAHISRKVRLRQFNQSPRQFNSIVYWRKDNYKKHSNDLSLISQQLTCATANIHPLISSFTRPNSVQ